MQKLKTSRNGKITRKQLFEVLNKAKEEKKTNSKVKQQQEEPPQAGYQSPEKKRILGKRKRKLISSLPEFFDEIETDLIHECGRPYKIIFLLDKASGEKKKYKQYMERDLDFLQATDDKKGYLILDFNMKNLELEYDYDTDEEQLKSAKEMLMKDNISAIDFVVKDDPILLVGNILDRNY